MQHFTDYYHVQSESFHVACCNVSGTQKVPDDALYRGVLLGCYYLYVNIEAPF